MELAREHIIALIGVLDSDGGRVWACLHGKPILEGKETRDER